MIRQSAFFWKRAAVQPFDNLYRLLLETAGLMALTGVMIVVGAWHYFGGFADAEAGPAIAFSLGALAFSAIPVHSYVVFRFLRLKQRNSRLQKAATEDALTGLFNRATFRATFDTNVARLGRRRNDTGAFAFLLIDADHFKKLNDTLGQAVGDQALRLIASTLRTSVRLDDVVGRLGGEEFGVLLRNSGIEETRIVAERLRASVNALVVGPKRAPLPLSISIGAVVFNVPARFEAAFRVADNNLYRAKLSGRNRSVLTNAVRIVRRADDNRGATRALGGPAEQAAKEEAARRSA